MQVGSAEYTVVRTYLDWILDLPVDATRRRTTSTSRAVRKVLDEDHYGLEKVKKRILEYLAVRKLKQDKKGPILCLIGPPGVGKTSLGRSIARALGRKFHRISLGGVHDEAAIRGHRRTYVGALPGQIIQGMKKVGTINPVFMLDEVDKIGHDFRGDPAAALLEVLDPEQNNTFADHYLEIPYDLSNVMFVATANVADPDPAAAPRPHGDPRDPRLHAAREARDRAAAPHPEAARGARHHARSSSTSPTRRVEEIIDHYTREAGVRYARAPDRERHPRRRGEDRRGRHRRRARSTNEDELREFLGAPRYTSEVAERTEETGVATGLAWTSVGGEILFIEATRMYGTGKLQLTGQLGDVMKESAQAALSLRAHATPSSSASRRTSSRRATSTSTSPRARMPKDGPTAGVTMFTALVSMLTGIRVRHDVAMTGEITLRGRVLPIGGLKEKVARGAPRGIKRGIIPERNKADLDEVPKEVKDELEFVSVSRMDQVLEAALETMPAPRVAEPAGVASGGPGRWQRVPRDHQLSHARRL